MKIVFVSKLAPHLGVRRIFEVGRRLVEAGHEVAVVSAATERSQPLRERVEGLEMFALPTAPRFLRTSGRVGFYATRLPFYATAPRFIRSHVERPDVIVEDIAPLWSPGLPSVARELDVPLVYQIHNAYGTWREWYTAYGPKGVFGYALERRLRRSPACVALYSDGKWSADSLEGIGCEVRWIPNGVDPDVFRPDTVRKEGRKVLEILNVARLVPLKNHETLIRAVKAHAGRVRLRILGSGPHLTKLRDLVASLGLDGTVSLEGHAEKDRLVAAYQEADLFCLPSLFEGLPHVALEAMASELPVAMSDIPAAEGIVEESYGWRLPARSVEAWSALIGHALEVGRDRLREMGRQARARAEERFSWEATTNAELELFEQAISTHRSLRR